MQHGEIIYVVQETQRVIDYTLCRKLRYFTLTDGDRFNGFYFFPSLWRFKTLKNLFSDIFHVCETLWDFVDVEDNVEHGWRKKKWQ